MPGARHVLMSQFDPEHKDLAKAKEQPVVLIDKDWPRPLGKAPRSGWSRPASSKVYTLGGGMLCLAAGAAAAGQGRQVRQR